MQRTLISTLLAMGAVTFVAAMAPPSGASNAATHCPDFNSNHTVDIADVALIVQHFGEDEGTPSWIPDLDLSGDGTITVTDVAQSVQAFGTICGEPVKFAKSDQVCSNDDPSRPQLVIVRTEEEWLEFCDHEPGASPPVDFDERMLVVVWNEYPTGGYDITIDHLYETDDALLVEVTQTSPGENCVVTQAFTSRLHSVSTAQTELPVELVVRDVVDDCAPPPQPPKDCPPDILPPEPSADCGPVLH